jgi:CheY-like chemotaxis protein
MISLDKILSDIGYSIELFMSSEEALVAMRTHGFDIILMDIEAPEKDGASSCGRRLLQILISGAL